ncbi:hypothetical protein U5801_29765, partial [Lamprobacter modestohalophilus]|nr:hypothetical protein [Lamprobacter modestohalophilus]
WHCGPRHRRPDMVSDNVDSWTEQWKQEGIDEGVQKGATESSRRMLSRLTYRRFGEATAEQSKPLLERIADADRLEELADDFVLCADGEAWLVALRAAADQ